MMSLGSFPPPGPDGGTASLRPASNPKGLAACFSGGKHCFFVYSTTIYISFLSSEHLTWLITESYSDTRKIMGRGRTFPLWIGSRHWFRSSTPWQLTTLLSLLPALRWMLLFEMTLEKLVSCFIFGDTFGQPFWKEIIIGTFQLTQNLLSKTFWYTLELKIFLRNTTIISIGEKMGLDFHD